MPATTRVRRKTVSYAKYGYMFIAPFFIAYAFFMIYPLINTFIMSFQGNNKQLGQWVGLKNYSDLLFGGGFAANEAQRQFLNSLSNTLILWAGNFLVQIILSLLLAVWFSDARIKIRGTGFFKVVMYLPNIITAASVAGMFLMLFGDTSDKAANSLLLSWGLIEEPIKFTIGEWSSRILVMFIQSWMWFGNTMLLLMSGIFGIDPSIYEAAEIDGSSGANTFFRITMPILKPIFIYVFITSMIGGLQMFDIPFMFHHGSTIPEPLKTIAVFIRQNFVGSDNDGRAAAASVLLFIVTCALGLLIYRFNSDSSAPKKAKKARGGK